MNKIIITIIATFVALFFFYILCLNHIGPNEYGVTYNKANGQMGTQEIGWHVTAPWVKATAIIDLPMIIDLTDNNSTSAYQRRFIPKFVKLKIKKEYIMDFFHDVGFTYNNSQISYLKQAYFQDVKPKWLEVLEE